MSDKEDDDDGSKSSSSGDSSSSIKSYELNVENAIIGLVDAAVEHCCRNFRYTEKKKTDMKKMVTSSDELLEGFLKLDGTYSQNYKNSGRKAVNRFVNESIERLKNNSAMEGFSKKELAKIIRDTRKHTQNHASTARFNCDLQNITSKLWHDEHAGEHYHYNMMLAIRFPDTRTAWEYLVDGKMLKDYNGQDFNSAVLRPEEFTEYKHIAAKFVEKKMKDELGKNRKKQEEKDMLEFRSTLESAAPLPPVDTDVSESDTDDYNGSEPDREREEFVRRIPDEPNLPPSVYSRAENPVPTGVTSSAAPPITENPVPVGVTSSAAPPIDSEPNRTVAGEKRKADYLEIDGKEFDTETVKELVHTSKKQKAIVSRMKQRLYGNENSENDVVALVEEYANTFESLGHCIGDDIAGTVQELKKKKLTVEKIGNILLRNHGDIDELIIGAAEHYEEVVVSISNALCCNAADDIGEKVAETINELNTVKKDMEMLKMRHLFTFNMGDVKKSFDRWEKKFERAPSRNFRFAGYRGVYDAHDLNGLVRWKKAHMDKKGANKMEDLRGYLFSCDCARCNHIFEENHKDCWYCDNSRKE